jgi:hypothetical protein
VNLEDGWLIVCGALIIVALFNIGLVLPILRGRGKIFHGSLRDIRFPWRAEEEAIDLLHEQVGNLKVDERGEEPYVKN